MRRCPKCSETKPAEAFSKGQRRCKACVRVAKRAATLRGNPNAKEYCVGTLEERFAHFFDETVTDPFDPTIAVDGCPNTPCKVGWKGTSSDGYPMMQGENRKMVNVHRWLYELHHGSIPEKFEVRHLCNRKCLTLEHLQAGTRVENQTDRIAAGTTLRGLSVEQVRTILRLKAEGQSQREIAREIGCTTQGTVSDIVNGEIYKEVSRVREPAGHQFAMF